MARLLGVLFFHGKRPLIPVCFFMVGERNGGNGRLCFQRFPHISKASEAAGVQDAKK